MVDHGSGLSGRIGEALSSAAGGVKVKVQVESASVGSRRSSREHGAKVEAAPMQNETLERVLLYFQREGLVADPTCTRAWLSAQRGCTPPEVAAALGWEAADSCARATRLIGPPRLEACGCGH